MVLCLHIYQGYPTVIANRMENRNWLALVPLTRWRTNRKIFSVSNRPVSWNPMSQCAPVSPNTELHTNVENYRRHRHFLLSNIASVWGFMNQFMIFSHVSENYKSKKSNIKITSKLVIIFFTKF